MVFLHFSNASCTSFIEILNEGNWNGLAAAYTRPLRNLNHWQANKVPVGLTGASIAVYDSDCFRWLHSDATILVQGHSRIGGQFNPFVLA